MRNQKGTLLGVTDLVPTPLPFCHHVSTNSLPGLPLSIWEVGLAPVFLGALGWDSHGESGDFTRQGLGPWGCPCVIPRCVCCY